MSNFVKKTLIPEPMITKRQESNIRSERYMKKSKINSIKLPEIHSPTYSSWSEDGTNRKKHVKKNFSQSNLTPLSTFRSSLYDRFLETGRPESLNNAFCQKEDAVIKRYHSSGQVYPHVEADADSMLWPPRKQDRFTEGYLKMQNLMNAKRDDLLKRNAKRTAVNDRSFSKQPPLSSLPLAPSSLDSYYQPTSRLDTVCTEDLLLPAHAVKLAYYPHSLHYYCYSCI